MSNARGICSRSTPQLLPADERTRQLFDLVYDASTASQPTTGRAPWQPTLNTARRALSLIVASVLWNQPISVSQRQLKVNNAVRFDVGRVVNGLIATGRLETFSEAVANACASLSHGPLVDYENRRRLVADRELDRHVIGRGLDGPAARLWLVEEYACADPLGFGWNAVTCARTRPAGGFEASWTAALIADVDAARTASATVA